MITNGTLVVLLPSSPAQPYVLGDDLSDMIHDASLRQYFSMMLQFTSEEKVFKQASESPDDATIVVVERGFFCGDQARDSFKQKLEESGIVAERILFGEDFPSGYHHIFLRIMQLCK